MNTLTKPRTRRGRRTQVQPVPEPFDDFSDIPDTPEELSSVADRALLELCARVEAKDRARHEADQWDRALSGHAEAMAMECVA
jgi:hypothetical protein